MDKPLSLGKLLRLKFFDDAIKLMNQMDWKYMSMCEGSDAFITNKNIDNELYHLRLLVDPGKESSNDTFINQAYLAYKKCHVAGQITIEERDEIIKELRSQV